MNERLKELRKKLGLTQQEFANKVGISRNNIAKYEVGINEPSTAVISLLCKTFHVSEEWLRNGVGEMFTDSSRVDRIKDFVNSLSEEDSFKVKLISMLSRMNEDEWLLLEKMVKRMMAENGIDLDEPAAPGSISSEDQKISTPDAEQEYIKNRLENAQKTEHSASNTIDGTDA